MADNCKAIEPTAPTAARFLPLATRQRRINLKSQRDVLREQARLYREARAGLIEIADATKFGYMLSMMSKTIAEIETSNKGEGKCYEDYLKEAHEEIVALQRQRATKAE